MKTRKLRLILAALVTTSLCLVAAPPSASAANSFCGRKDFATLHNGHYDTWRFVAHGTELPYNHWHSWTNLTHSNTYHRENYCPETQ